AGFETVVLVSLPRTTPRRPMARISRSPVQRATATPSRPSCRQECRARGITSRIARRGLESSIHLGRHRWIVERTFAWLARYRRLSIRYERRANIHLAFTTLACALVCLGQIRRSC
ncbi:transposase, partial [Roseomonas sp. SXEYE001]